MSENNTSSTQGSAGSTARRLLVAVSEQKEHMLGLRFLSSFLHSRKGVMVELFHLHPARKSTLHGPYGTIMGQGEMDEGIFKMHLERGKEAMIEARQRLLDEGFHQDAVEVKFASPKEALEWDMLNEVRRGHFDAIVMGNRGRSWLERALEGQVDIGEELLHATCVVPLWICAEPRPHSSHVLLCLDGSEMAYRMTEHVGKILASEEQHQVTMLRVKRDKPAGLDSPEHIFNRGSDILRSAGIAGGRIASKVVEDNDVFRAIMSQAEELQVAAIASGRHGVGAGLMKNVFMGSVTEKLFRKMKQGALWVQC